MEHVSREVQAEGLDTLGQRHEWYSTTHKVEIKSWISPEGAVMDVNLFIHLVWDEGLNLIKIHCDGLNGQTGSVKAVLREYCRELSERLERREIGLRYICKRWIAQRFDPAGICPQAEGPVSSLLDGAAKVLMKRYLKAGEV
jgi:hypothetical protein